MKKNKEAILIAKHISNFINDYAPMHRTTSIATLKAYEDTLTLYLEFLEVEKRITPQILSANCFSMVFIEDWLVWLSKTRENKPQTCNNRLSSLRVFLKYLSSREVSMTHIYIEALAVPFRKTVKNKIKGISKKAVEILLTLPNLSNKTGRRDLVLIITMYNTAIRISEILSLQMKNVHLDAEKPSITILGKGNKLRTLSLSPKTVLHLKQYIKEFHGDHPNPESYLFYSRNTGITGQLDAETIRKRFNKYAKIGHEVCSEIPIGLHPHQIRHARATHWLEDGINIVQISFLLGHEQLETTMKYLDITLEQVGEAMAVLETVDDTKMGKKWKNHKKSLKEFCNMKK